MTQLPPEAPAPRVRPALSRAKQIIPEDVVFFEGARNDFIVLAEKVWDNGVSGLRVLNGKLVPVHVNAALMEARSVLVPNGGLAGLILQHNDMNSQSFRLSEISDEQETLVRIATMSEDEAGTRNYMLRNEAIGLIADLAVRAQLAVKYGLADHIENIIHYVTDVGVLQELIADKLGVSSYRDFDALLNHFFDLDANAFAEWVEKEGRKNDAVCYYLRDRLPSHPKFLDVMTQGSLRTRCLIADRFDDDSWKEEHRALYDSAVSDKDPWFACFLFMRIEDKEDLILPLLDQAEAGILRLKAGERPDVPWRKERYGTTDFSITDEWCDEWLAAIASWSEPRD